MATYRQYENPYTLEAELERVKAERKKLKAMGQLDVYEEMDYAMYIADLEERVNFAWQDDEFECSSEF